jgi:predicted metal-dependent hydrolase
VKQPLPHRIERTRNRASRAVLRDGEVIIRLAGRLTAKEESEHVAILLGRMAKAAAKEVKRRKIDPFEPLVKKSVETVTVETVTGHGILFAMLEGPKTRAVPMDGGWRMQRSEKISDPSFRRFLWRLASISLKEVATTAVLQINAETFRVPVKSVSLKYMRSRWGSCSTNGTIALSTALLFTSPDIFRYVVIHELAHVLHMNHSHRFWAAVEKHEPHYKRHVKGLRGYRLSK